MYALWWAVFEVAALGATSANQLDILKLFWVCLREAANSNNTVDNSSAAVTVSRGLDPVIFT